MVRVPVGDIYGSNYHYVYYSYGSPAIDTEADSIFYVATDGGAYISDYISTYSYGYNTSPGIDNNHRSYRVRSDGIIGIYDLLYGSSYGKFRSPGTGGFDANYAWNVDKSGNIPLFSDHENSYGHTFIRSPAIDTVADSIFYVATNGGAYISDYISTYSYGSPNTNFGVNVCYVDPAGVFGSGSYNNVSDSYGMHVYPLSGHELFKRRMEYFKF